MDIAAKVLAMSPELPKWATGNVEARHPSPFRMMDHKSQLRVKKDRIANDVLRLARIGDITLSEKVLDAIIELQDHRDATDIDIQVTSELYAFIVDHNTGEIHSDIQNWTEATKSVKRWLALS